MKLGNNVCLNPLPNHKFLDWSKLKAFCRWQNKHNLKTQILVKSGRKHCGKRRKCWLPAFSHFLTMFSEGFFFRVVKLGLYGKGLRISTKRTVKIGTCKVDKR